jgi:hypothetical protein
MTTIKTAQRNTSEADDRVRHVVIGLAIVQIRDRKGQARVLHQGLDPRVGVDDIGSGLFPLPRIGHHVVEISMDDLTHLAAGPKVDFGRRARTAAGLIAGDLRRFPGRGIGRDGPHQAFYYSTIVRGEEHIAEIRRGNGLHLVAEVALDDPDQLGEQDVGRGRAAWLCGVAAGEVPCQLKDERLEAPPR